LLTSAASGTTSLGKYTLPNNPAFDTKVAELDEKFWAK
jgi:hypothetical protein